MSHHEVSSPFIPVQNQPAQVLEYAQSRDIDPRVVLQGTGLSAQDILDRPRRITPAHLLNMLGQTAGALASPDTSFMLGQQALPGHFGPVSQALLQAPTLRHALETIVAHQAILSPLLVPHLHVGDQQATFYWTDAFGAPGLRPLLVEMSMAALTGVCRWLGDTRFDWVYCFNRTRPRHTEQHEVHLGPQLRFNCHLDAMLINTEWLDRPWPRGSTIGHSVSLRAATEASQADSAHVAMLSALYEHLLTHIRCAPSMEHTAAHFGVSPATFKRQLARHGTHFQAELDQVRTHVAIQLFHERGFDNEGVASYLGFHDANNFRRSFKRWTGLTPSLLRDALLQPHC